MRSISDVRFDGGASGRSRGPKLRQYRVRVAVIKAVLLAGLLSRPKRRSETAADVFRRTLPGRHGVLTPGPDEAREEAEAPGADLADDDPDAAAQAA